MKRKYNLLILLAMLFLIARILLIFCVEDITNIEGLYVGTVAKHLIEGLIMPFWDYQFSSYDGGVLASGVLTAPFFLLFGQTVFALALVGVFFSLATFILWYLFLEKYFSKSAANLAALMFICAPPFFTRYSVVTAGNHSQSSFFTILFLFIIYRILFYQREKSKSIDYGITFFFLGLVAGFGTWFCYTFLVTLVLSLLLWWVWDRTLLRKKDYVIFFSAFLLGFSPAFARLEVFFPFLKEEIFGELFVNNVVQAFHKFKHIIISQLPASFFFERPLFAWGYYIVFIIFLFLLIYKHKNSFKRLIIGILPSKRFRAREDTISKEIFIIIYPFIYIIIYSFSGFNVLEGDTNYLHYRYFLPLFPFIFGIVALGIDSLLRNKRNFIKIMGLCVVAFLLFTGILSNINLLNHNSFFHNLKTRLKDKGFSFEMLGTVICWRFKDNPPRSIELLNHIKKKYIPDAYRGFGFEFGVLNGNDSERYLKLIEDSCYRAEFYKGVGLGLAHQYFEGTELEESYFSEILRGNCKEFLSKAEKRLELVKRLDENYKAGCYKGMGMQFSILCEDCSEKYFKFIEDIKPWYKVEFYRGVDLGSVYR